MYVALNSSLGASRPAIATTLTVLSVLIVSGVFSRQVKSLGLRLLPEVTLAEQGETGTITFGDPNQTGSIYFTTATPATTQRRSNERR